MDEVVGYCNYCKEEIFEYSDYVKHKNKLYHVDCYNQMKEELDVE